MEIINYDKTSISNCNSMLSKSAYRTEHNTKDSHLHVNVKFKHNNGNLQKDINIQKYSTIVILNNALGEP